MTDDPVKDALLALIDERIAAALTRASKPANDEYLSTSRAAHVASVSVGTIRRWVRENRLTKHVAQNRVKIRRSELERYLTGSPKNESPAEKARKKHG